ncbi:MAG TPA: stimulus-sensing domain-containing protein [Azospirillaceae bacterium]|nr:stimulus-sensing domain-containing protein [Azospirillaceae bacterium]
MKRRARARLRQRGGRGALSPLTLRVLALNILALLFLAFGLLYLGRYQERLVAAELDALLGQARVFAAAMGEGATAEYYDEQHAIDTDAGRAMVRRLFEAARVRTRLFDAQGSLMADSRFLGGPGGTVQIVELPPADDMPLLTRIVHRIYDWVVLRAPSWDDLPPYRETPGGGAADHPDALRALTGEASASVWKGADGGLVLTAAVPVQRLRQILGVVLVSKPGTEIAEAVRGVRLEVLQVFGVALLITSLLSVWLAQTIARPIRRLARAADRVRPGHGAFGAGTGRRAEIPDFRARRDEIGDLSGALRDMTAALWTRMDAIERFAADVAHEIKNPLASLRSAVETAGRIADPERRAKLMAVIEHDVRRLDRLITDISAASRLDAELSRAEPEAVDLRRMLATLVDMHAATHEGVDGAPRLVLAPPRGPSVEVMGVEGRLVQVFRNLVANAVSFSPPGGTVTLGLSTKGETAEVTVVDEGPGIPEGKFEAIFERFYSERPASEGFGQHSGLGLSISRQIVEALGGRITAANRTGPDGRVRGAVFTVVLPLT